MLAQSKIKLEPHFIQRLLEKLKTGNRRSVHLNAVPGRLLNRLDLSDLSHIDEAIPLAFMQKLLAEKQFKLNISAKNFSLDENPELHKLQQRLNRLVNQDREDFLEFGQQNFSFGYPLLIKHDKQDVTKIIKAPLIIWNLSISRSERDKNSWIIERSEDAPIKTNELLISHIAKDEGLDFPQLSEEILEDNLVDQTELLNYCREVLRRLGSMTGCDHLAINKCPEAKTLEAEHHQEGTKRNAWIQFSGIFSLYKAPKEAIIKATQEIADAADQPNEAPRNSLTSKESTVSSIDTNPSQEQIINSLENDEIKLIQGPPGTGKSQSITAIISNALENDNKCLLICEKKVALEVVLNNLEKLNLHNLVALIDDVNRDRQRIVKKARDIHDQYSSNSDNPFDPSEFESSLQCFQQSKQEYNDKHAETARQVFGTKSRKQLIGRYLKKSRHYNIVDNYNEQLRQLNLTLDSQQQAEISQQLKTAQELYIKISDYADKVANGVDNAFIRNNPTLTTPIRHAYQQLINECASITLGVFNILESQKAQPNSLLIKNLLGKYNEEELKTLKADTEQLLVIADAITGTTYQFQEDNPSITYKKVMHRRVWLIISNWSKKGKLILQLKRYLATQHGNFNQVKKRLEPTVFALPHFTSYRSCESFEQFIAFVKELKDSVAAHNNALSAALQFRQYLEENTLRLQNILGTQKILNLDMPKCNSSDLLDLEAMQSNYAKLVNNFNQRQEHFDKFDDFYNWQSFTSNKCAAPFLNILHIFMQEGIPAEQWADRFEHWYDYEILSAQESSSEHGFHTSDGLLNKISRLNANLIKWHPRKIGNTWRARKNKAFHDLAASGSNFNLIYNLKGSKRTGRRRNSLRKIIEKDFELFTSMFPVVMTNPATACILFNPARAQSFDYVIFDEASQLRIEDTFANLLLGKRKIVVGDEHQMPPVNYFWSDGMAIDGEDDEGNSEEQEQSDILAESQSLLEYTENLLVDKQQKSYLDYHYRSRHPDLISFSNSAIYGGNLIPRPAQTNYEAIDFKNIGGTYFNSSARGDLKNTNRDEALEILRILKEEIKPKSTGAYPSVGIVTFNLSQRDLIYDLISKEIVDNETFSQLYHGLEDAGFFIRNLDSVQGDERDVIIISTTFGITENGSFRQKFGPLNMPDGYKRLNVLITRAKFRIYVRTSIPESYYRKAMNEIQETTKNGRLLLYAYLYYCSLIAENRQTDVANLLEHLREQAPEKSRMPSEDVGLTESPFEEEVYQELIHAMPGIQIKPQHKAGGFRLDFLIGQKVALECDGKTYHQSEEAYKHDMYRQKELEGMGYVFHRIWSTNWFRDKDQEVRKFIDFYKKVSSSLSP